METGAGRKRRSSRGGDHWGIKQGGGEGRNLGKVGCRLGALKFVMKTGPSPNPYRGKIAEDHAPNRRAKREVEKDGVLVFTITT